MEELIGTFADAIALPLAASPSLERKHRTLVVDILWEFVDAVKQEVRKDINRNLTVSDRYDRSRTMRVKFVED